MRNPQMASPVRELRAGLKEGHYRRVACKICGRPAGWAHKRFFGLAIYCDLCVDQYGPGAKV